MSDFKFPVSSTLLDATASSAFESNATVPTVAAPVDSSDYDTPLSIQKNNPSTVETSALDEPRIKTEFLQDVDSLDIIGALSDQPQIQADITLLMTMILKLNIEQKKADRETRVAELESLVSSLLDAADKIEDAAKKRLIGAMVGVAVSIGCGAAQIGGGLRAQKLQNDAAKLQPQNPGFQRNKAQAAHAQRTFEVGQNQYNQQMARANNVANMTQPGAMMGQSLSQSTTSAADYAAATDEKEKALIEAAAKKEENALEQTKEWISNVVALLSSYLSSMSQMQQTQHEVSMRIAGRG
jgi:hypothetical protein